MTQMPDSYPDTISGDTLEVEADSTSVFELHPDDLALAVRLIGSVCFEEAVSVYSEMDDAAAYDPTVAWEEICAAAEADDEVDCLLWRGFAYTEPEDREYALLLPGARIVEGNITFATEADLSEYDEVLTS